MTGTLRVQRRRSTWAGWAALWTAFLLTATTERIIAEPALDAGVPFEVVVVDIKSDPSGIVSATLVNRLNHSVRNVRLLVRHEWLWNDEMSPGPDVLNPGRSSYYTVEGSIAAEGRKEFVYRPEPPLRGSSSGTFRTTVEVVGFDEVGD